ncbi:MAG: hypothetical protein IJU84_09470 [Clostridia bacterium]|nr:hypothetical protein [Clostridia bacterium]
MVTRERSLENFMIKADEVVSGKYLFATKKIAELLETVSTSKMLFEIFDFCCNGEEFDDLKSLGFHSAGDGKHGYFTMPENQKQAVALCFYVLKDIVDGKIDFNTFLTSFFSSENILKAYDVFTSELIVPFRNTVKNMAETVIGADGMRKNRNAWDSTQKEKKDMDMLYLQEVISLLEGDKRSVLSSAGLTEEFISDAVSVIDEMILAAKANNVKLLRALSVGYKHLFRRNKKLQHNCAEVLEFLTDHGVIVATR